jgi:hypothetical protein
VETRSPNVLGRPRPWVAYWASLGLPPRACNVLYFEGGKIIAYVQRLRPPCLAQVRNCGPGTLQQIGYAIGGWGKSKQADTELWSPRWPRSSRGTESALGDFVSLIAPIHDATSQWTCGTGDVPGRIYDFQSMCSITPPGKTMTAAAGCQPRRLRLHWTTKCTAMTGCAAGPCATAQSAVSQLPLGVRLRQDPAILVLRRKAR